jgi:DNA-binding helix-hairpin-helix protein with protein kinase domain
VNSARRRSSWRASIEQQFRFDPNEGIYPEDLRQAEQELQQKRAESIRTLMAGPQQLTRTLQQWDVRSLHCQTEDRGLPGQPMVREPACRVW